MQRRQLAALLCLCAMALPASADLKPDIIDCDMGKAAKNAAMKATVGVHGPCDADRLADDVKDDAKDRADDVKDGARDYKDDAKDRREDRKDKRDKD